MNKKFIFLTVRSKSLRLPYKCFLPVGGTEAILLLLSRLQSKKYKLIVLTTYDKSDDYLCKLLKKNNFFFYRGSVNNVYSRYIECAKKFNLKKNDIIVRLTADNLFLDRKFVVLLIKEFKKRKISFLRIDRKKSKLPYGLAAEVFTFDLINSFKPKNMNDAEHVTLQVKRNKKLCYNAVIKSPTNLYNKSCTLDTIDDYIKIYNIFSNIKDPTSISWEILCKKLKNSEKKYFKPQMPNTERIILGAAQFGFKYGINNNSKITQNEVEKILVFANKIGINKIDTSRNYLLSEKRIYKSIKKYKLSFKIFTKISSSKSFEDLKRQFAISMNTLKRIDYLLLHNLEDYFKYKKDLKEYFSALTRKRIIKKIGVSVNYPGELSQVINSKTFSFFQIPFNILDKRWDNFLTKKNMPLLIIRSIFLQGLFFANRKNISKKISPHIKNISEKLRYLAESLDRYDVKDLMLSYVMSKKNINQFVIGLDNEIQAKEFLFYLTRKKLTNSEIKLIDSHFRRINNKILSPVLWN
jgi:spore coat polysaccharide biosynthesis protein SpsF